MSCALLTLYISERTFLFLFNFAFVHDQQIILFDGVCNFCNSTINFIIKKDKKKIFRFAALQSEAGKQLLKQYNLPTDKLDSFVLLKNGKAYKKTTAALHLYPQLGTAWKLVNIFWVFPALIRDVAYNIIANNRYRWFGKKDHCMIPSAEVRSLFL